MKVFCMNDCDWMAAETLEEAKASYLKDYWGGGKEHEDEAFDAPYELTPEQMEKMMFQGDDYTCSFQEELNNQVAAGQTFPCFFASTEY